MPGMQGGDSTHPEAPPHQLGALHLTQLREDPPPLWINHICSELSKSSLAIKDTTLVFFFQSCNEQALCFRFIKTLKSKVYMGKNLEVREGEAGLAFAGIAFL